MVQIDEVVGDAKPDMDQLRALTFTTRVINEAMRLYPQPPVLIRRAINDDVLGGYHVAAGSDIFISVWNIHRCSPHHAREARRRGRRRIPQPSHSCSSSEENRRFEITNRFSARSGQ